MRLPTWCLWLALIPLIRLAGTGFVEPSASGANAVLYETRFEPGGTDGFDPSLTLIGQGGWVGYGSGGNGLVTNFFEGQGQHAFIGFTAPTNRDEFLNVWRPVNFRPGGTNASIVRFSVLMSIEDSTGPDPRRDDFRWSAYNSGTNRLFTLDFDNEALGINYLLDDGKFIPTGVTFTNSTPYQLEVVMDFGRNRWSATLNGSQLVTNLAITTQGVSLDFGDMDAVWAIRTPGSPGDNFMVFDNYRLESESVAHPPSVLEPLGLLKPGEFLVRCRGTPGATYVLQATADLRRWSNLKTNAMPADGYFDHLDKGGGSLRFYRLLEP